MILGGCWLWRRGSCLLRPQPGARKKFIPAELVQERVARMCVGEWDALYRVEDGAPAIKHACAQLVSNRVPGSILPWLMGACLVALLKPGGGVRPIACGEVLRRLTGKVVCRQMRMRFAAHFGAPSEEGAASSAAQMGVGGDPLGPFFMAAPLHPVLRAVLRAHPEVYVIAYLDDIHILGEPDSVRAAYDTAVPLLVGIGLEPNGALEHDLAIQRCLKEVAGSPYPLGGEAVALSQLPTRWGGLGLTSAQRLAPASGVVGVLGARVEAHDGAVFTCEGLVPAPGRAGGHRHGGESTSGELSLGNAGCEGREEACFGGGGERSREHVVPEGLRILEEAPSWMGEFCGDGLEDVHVEGRWTIQFAWAKKFLEECVEQRQDRRLGPEIISATWYTPTCMSYWGQKIMIALQGAQAFGLHSRALEDFPQ
ncbi:hypothetical protein CYMTET_55047 [Cymbomonas tetramitiformis]|uniref:Reverse transcriptase domain-containing protein n=1 Tax=Cymbomonas tetramitiformis TaxID=36881 RepID=A0AAE0BFH9_9CHLO|nr:hypothetical protein CYMTET_55047 [Cymbomonas tetramitiformis]